MHRVLCLSCLLQLYFIATAQQLPLLLPEKMARQAYPRGTGEGGLGDKIGMTSDKVVEQSHGRHCTELDRQVQFEMAQRAHSKKYIKQT